MVHKKTCTKISIEDLCIGKKKNTLTAVDWEVAGLTIRDSLQLNINNFKEPKIKTIQSVAMMEQHKTKTIPELCLGTDKSKNYPSQP